MTPPKLNAVLIQKILFSPELAVLKVAPDGWKIPGFQAGQYCAMGLPGSSVRCEGSKPDKAEAPPDKLILRAYSLASSPDNRDYLEIYITLVPDGALTPRLFSLNQGDRLFASPKITGSFTLDGVPPEANLLLISTGTGLAPYMSMLASPGFMERTGKVAVLHGVRHSWDLGYRSELETLQRAVPRINYLPTVSRAHQEPAEWRGYKGYVQDFWKKGILDELWRLHPKPSDTHVFMCGNPAMIDELQKLLEGEGFTEHTKRTPGNIHLERYW